MNESVVAEGGGLRGEVKRMTLVVHVQPVPDCLSDNKGFFVVIESWQQRHDNLRTAGVTEAKHVHKAGVNRPSRARGREFRPGALFQGHREL